MGVWRDRPHNTYREGKDTAASPRSKNKVMHAMLWNIKEMIRRDVSLFSVGGGIDPTGINEKELRHLAVSMREDAPAMNRGAGGEVFEMNHVRKRIAFSVKPEGGNGVFCTHVRKVPFMAHWFHYLIRRAALFLIHQTLGGGLT